MGLQRLEVPSLKVTEITRAMRKPTRAMKKPTRAMKKPTRAMKKPQTKSRKAGFRVLSVTFPKF